MPLGTELNQYRAALSGSTTRTRPPGRVTRAISRSARRDVADVLQDGDAEGRVEVAVRERAAARIGRREADAGVDPARRRMRLAHPLDEQVDAEQVHLRHAQPRQAHLRRARAASDVEDALARARLQRLLEEFRERVVPPVLAQVFQRRGREGVEVATHIEAGDSTTRSAPNCSGTATTLVSC